MDTGWPTLDLDLVLYAAGWSIGWMMLWRPRPLPPAPIDLGGDRPAVAVVIPARNEATALPSLLGPLTAQLRRGDELVVVDDHSDDATAQVAAASGATVLSAPDLPHGWLGKPNACWHGASSTSAPVLLFVDADVRPAVDLLDRIRTAVVDHPNAVVSVQPWHHTETFGEQAGILCNVTALMGSGAFAGLPRSITSRRTSSVAYGPVLAVARDAYDRAGGHADEQVRAMHTEDIGLARAVGSTQLFTGAPDTSFRMYPGGLGDTVRGWTRSIATGARHAPWWATLATLVWVWSLAGGWIASPWVYPLSAIQVWVLGRRAASVHPVTALLYPVAVLVFAVIIVRSAMALLLGRSVDWKGRTVRSR